MRGVGGSPPTPLTIKKPGCQGKSFDSLSREIFDANFLKKDLAKPRFKAYAIRMKIEIEMIASSEIGRCYYEHRFEIRSPYPLSDTQINGLRSLGLIGYGQEFSFRRDGVRDDLHVVNVKSRVDSSD